MSGSVALRKDEKKKLDKKTNAPETSMDYHDRMWDEEQERKKTARLQAELHGTAAGASSTSTSNKVKRKKSGVRLRYDTLHGS